MYTISNQKLLVLYMAVLIQRAQILTSLEMIMSFWALGFMLDEVHILLKGILTR